VGFDRGVKLENLTFSNFLFGLRRKRAAWLLGWVLFNLAERG